MGASALDVVRTLVRRTERRMSAVEGAELRTFSDGTKAYMNRLSTLLFALARLANFAEGVKEENPSYEQPSNRAIKIACASSPP